MNENVIFKYLQYGIFQFVRKKQYEESMQFVLKELKAFLRRMNVKRIISINGEKISIRVDDIQYIVSLGHESIIHLSNDEEYTLKKSLGHALQEIDYLCLVQIQRNLAINLKYIKNYQKTKIVTLDNQCYSVGRIYQDELLMQYENYLLEYKLWTSNLSY